MSDDNEKTNEQEQQDSTADKQSTQSDAPSKKADNEKTFTQAELNDIVQGRLSKKEKAIADELGMTVEEAKKQLQAKKDKDEADKSEIQKLTEKMEAMEKQAKEAQDNANRMKRESQIKDKATELNFNDPTDAITFLDQSKFEYDDSGNITNAEKLLTELAEAKKYLIKQVPTFQNPANPGGGKKPLDENERLRKLGFAVPKR